MTTPTPDALEALAAFCRKHGLRRLKAGDVEMEFAAASDPADVARTKALTDEFAKGQPTDEDMLFWSAPQVVKALEDARRNGTEGGDA